MSTLGARSTGSEALQRLDALLQRHLQRNRGRARSDRLRAARAIEQRFFEELAAGGPDAAAAADRLLRVVRMRDS